MRILDLDAATDLLRESVQRFPQAVVFDDWSEFGKLVKQATTEGFSTEEELCEKLGLNFALYTKLVRLAIENWRYSTSTSPLHGIANIINTIPKAGDQVFPDLMWQTRFLLIVQKISPVSVRGIINPDAKRDDFLDRFVKVRGEKALSVRIESLTTVNDMLRCLYAYHVWTSRKQLKLPKWIYRGVRAQDLFNHDNIKPLVAHIWKTDQTHAMRRRDVMNILINFILEKKLHTMVEGKILSFSASQSIGKYFANGSGMILRVDPKRVEIVTSEVHDKRLSGGDAMTGKNEREYIVRIPEDYAFAKEDIIISDLYYFVAEQNPLCVAMFDHDDKEATYEIDGQEVTAHAYWKTGTSLSKLFRLKGERSYYGRVEFKKIYGFDPLPTEANLDSITNFRLGKRKRY